jgi:hypothetical protein
MEFVRDTLEALRTAGKLRDVNSTVATFSLFGTLLWLPRWYRPDGPLNNDQIVQEITNIATGGLIRHACEDK